METNNRRRNIIEKERDRVRERIRKKEWVGKKKGEG